MTTRLPGILVLEAEPSGAPAPAGVPAASLAALVRTLRLRQNEWRVLITIIAASGPLTAGELSRRLRLDYGTVRRVVRGLVRWSIVERTPSGVQFQPDPSRWREPTATPEPRP